MSKRQTKQVHGLRQVAVSNNPKHRVGVTKVPLSLIPRSGKVWQALAHLDGALKYGPYNWRVESVNARIYLEAIERHADALLDGEWLADDSLLPHCAHLMACCAIIMDAASLGKLIDDRPLPGAAAKLQKEAMAWIAWRTARDLPKPRRTVRKPKARKQKRTA